MHRKAEPRLDLLTKDYITPNELFYVRNRKFLLGAYVVQVYADNILLYFCSGYVLLRIRLSHTFHLYAINTSNSILHAYTDFRPRSARN